MTLIKKILLIFSISLFSATITTDMKFNNNPFTNYSDKKWLDVALPNEFIVLTQKAVQFAFNNNAAKEISFNDFDHFHLLNNADKYSLLNKWTSNDVLEAVKNTKAILFHSQELVKYPGFTNRRNIYLSLKEGRPKILDPSLYGKEPPHYTIDERDLGLNHIIQGYLIDITSLKHRRQKNMFIIYTSNNERTILITFSRCVSSEFYCH